MYLFTFIASQYAAGIASFSHIATYIAFVAAVDEFNRTFGYATHLTGNTSYKVLARYAATAIEYKVGYDASCRHPAEYALRRPALAGIVYDKVLDAMTTSIEVSTVRIWISVSPATNRLPVSPSREVDVVHEHTVGIGFTIGYQFAELI